MATREVAVPETQPHLRFIVAVIDGCIESEWAVLELSGAGLRAQNIQMFFDHRKPVHVKSAGPSLGRLQVTFQYLEDLLGLGPSTSMEYESHWAKGRHVLLANIYRDSDVRKAAAILGLAHSHAGRILAYGHTTKLLAIPV